MTRADPIRWSCWVNGNWRLTFEFRDGHAYFVDYEDYHSMSMQHPPHPGEFIIEVYLKPNGLSGRELAGMLGVSASTLSRVLNGESAISPEMALRLAKALGRSAESWLAMQSNHDLWLAKARVKLAGVRKARLTAA
jgi:addiction module HigA family antidote